MKDERPTCHLCGGPIEGEVYRWDDDKRLTMHKNFSQCLDNGSFGMAGTAEGGPVMSVVGKTYHAREIPDTL